MSAPSTRDRVLDFWRGLSVALVIFHHQIYFHIPFFKALRAEDIAPFFGALTAAVIKLNVLFLSAAELAGPTGVKLFFIISGYIITKILLIEEEKKGGISIRNFYIRRIFRIMPAFLVYLIAVALFAFLGWIAIRPVEIATALGFICNMEYSCSWHVAHIWSLSIEEQFYIVWPFLFVFALRSRRALLLTAIIGVLSVLAFFEVGVAQDWINNPISFLCITLGAFIAVSPRFLSFVRERGIIAFGAALLVLIVCFKLFPANYIVRHIYHVVLPFVLASAIFTTYRFTFIRDTKLFGWIADLGLMSFSLYLWQEAFSGQLSDYRSASLLDISVLMFPIAYLSYRYIELPASAWAKDRLRKEELKRNERVVPFADEKYQDDRQAEARP